MGRSGMGGAGGGRSAGGHSGGDRSGGMGGGRFGAGAGRSAGGAGRFGAGAGRPGGGRPGPAPAPRGPVRHRRRPFVRPMPFGLVSRFATDYVVCMAVMEALERLYQGYGTYEDEMRCRDFFGRVLLASEYYDCYLWMREYMRECW